MFAFFMLCFAVVVVAFFYRPSSFGLFSSVLYPSLVSPFVCSIIGCVTICSLSLCMTEQKPKSNNGARQIKWHRFFFFSLRLCFRLNNHFFFFCAVPKILSVSFVVLCRVRMRHNLYVCYIVRLKRFVTCFVRCCDWFGRFNQWQNSISFVDYYVRQ